MSQSSSSSASASSNALDLSGDDSFGTPPQAQGFDSWLLVGVAAVALLVVVLVLKRK